MFRLFEKSEEDGCYNLTSYQSTQVLDILLSNQAYRAYKSITFAKGYQALIDILGLDCVCPIFACVMGKPSCADGRVSRSEGKGSADGISRLGGSALCHEKFEIRLHRDRRASGAIGY